MAINQYIINMGVKCREQGDRITKQGLMHFMREQYISGSEMFGMALQFAT